MLDPIEKQNECASPTLGFNSRWQEEATISPRKAQADFLKQIFSKTEGSIHISIIRLTIPLFKLIATIVVISGNGSVDEDVAKLNKWFVLIMINDLISVILKSLVIKNQLDLEKARRSSTLPDLLRIDGNFQVDDILGGTSASVDIMSSSRYNKINKTKRILDLLWWLKVAFHVGLVVYGNILYSDCPVNEGSARMTLALVHLVIGYIYIGVPTLLIFFTFLWFAVISLRLCKKETKKKKRPSQQIELDKLKTEKYMGNIEGYHECSICGKEYTKGQDIIRLDCNSTHHFHKNCLKTELKKANSCPLCGVDLKSDKNITMSKIAQDQMNISYLTERIL